MSNEEAAKLKTLLNYWIEHNREHSQEFKEWADRVKALGAVETSKEMLQAVREMDKASECLVRALRNLE
jgi:nickel/cobalt exporter